MAKKDLTKLKHIIVPSTLHFYYETQDDGTNVLRHVRVNSHNFGVPADGITIDTLPPGSVGPEQLQTGSVGSDQIGDGSVNEVDLSEGVRGKLTQTYDENGETLYINGAKPKA